MLPLGPHQEAVAVQLEPERLVKILEVLRELPVPNYRYAGPPTSPDLPQPRLPLRQGPSLPAPRPQPYSCPV